MFISLYLNQGLKYDHSCLIGSYTTVTSIANRKLFEIEVKFKNALK